MIIHSIYLHENILPPGRNERHKFLLGHDVEQEGDSVHIQGVRYQFEATNQGIIVRNKPKGEEKQLACFVPWSNILQVIYKPEVVQAAPQQGKR